MKKILFLFFIAQTTIIGAMDKGTKVSIQPSPKYVAYEISDFGTLQQVPIEPIKTVVRKKKNKEACLQCCKRFWIHFLTSPDIDYA